MKKHISKFIIFAACTIMLSNFIVIFAFAENSVGAKEIVFVLDASGSMQGNDAEHLAADAINQMINSMLSNVDVGFVAFGDGVTDVVPLTGHDGREKLTQKVSATSYIGYTDAGGALETAVSLFSGTSPAARYIVILSDGEIAMKAKEETAHSVAQYEAAVATAKNKDITIFTIGLEDELADVNNSIFEAAKQSGGKTYYAPTADDLQNTINTILWSDLGFRKSSVASVTASGKEDHITVKLPGAGADTVRILLSSAASVGDMSVNCSSEEMKIYSGKKFGIVELKKPTAQDIEVRFTGSAGQRVSAELVAEYRAVADAAVTYEDDINYERVLRTATVNITLKNFENQNENLLADSYFEGKDVRLTIAGEEQDAKIQNGAIMFQREVASAQTLDIGVALPYSSINMFPVVPVSVILEAPPPPPIPPPTWTVQDTIALVIGGMLVLGAIVTAVIMRLRRPYRCEINYAYGFFGKLDCYIVWAKAGEYEIPPFSFQLGQLDKQKKINLAQLLQLGNINLEFQGAEKIWFFVGPEKSLLVKNNSKAELIFAGSTIGTGGQVQLVFGQKIYICFERDVDEIELYYRNVKDMVPTGAIENHKYTVRV